MRFNLRTLLYAIAVLAAGMGTFGRWGIFAACAVLAVWGSVFFYALKGKGWGNVVGVMAIVLPLLGLALPDLLGGRIEGRSWECHYNIRQIALALLLYAADHGRLPPPHVAGPDGKPMHSWRVLILPYIDEKELYDRYDFAEPWNGPNNSLLAQTAPLLYRCPSDSSGGLGTTSYFAVVGPRTAWTPGSGRQLDDLTDGPEQTLLLIEAAERGVNWLDPQDISYEEALRLLTAGNADDAQAAHVLTNNFEITRPARNVALADGTSLLSRVGWSEEAARAVLSIAGEEDVGRWITRQRVAQWRGPTRMRIVIFGIAALVPLPWAASQLFAKKQNTDRPPTAPDSHGAGA